MKEGGQQTLKISKDVYKKLIKDQINTEVSKTIRSIFDKNQANKFSKPFEQDYESKIADIVNPYQDIQSKLNKGPQNTIPPISKLTLNNLIIKNKIDQRPNIFQNINRKKAIKALTRPDNSIDIINNSINQQSLIVSNDPINHQVSFIQSKSRMTSSDFSKSFLQNKTQNACSQPSLRFTAKTNQYFSKKEEIRLNSAEQDTFFQKRQENRYQNQRNQQLLPEIQKSRLSSNKSSLKNK